MKNHFENVIVINEECHGFIGVAHDVPSAIDFLCQIDWLNEYTEIYSHDIASACTLEERFGKSKWIEAVEKMNFYTFNTLFDPYFQIRSEPLIG